MAFDTGAFNKRLYHHVLLKDMQVEDFLLEKDVRLPSRVIRAVFSTLKAYFYGDTTKMITSNEGAEPWEYFAKAYLTLLSSSTNNEPDDRLCSIEIIFDINVAIRGNLKAVVVPHTLWDDKKAPRLNLLSDAGVEIRPYLFVPGRHPEHYHAQLEAAVRDLYSTWRLGID